MTSAVRTSATEARLRDVATQHPPPERPEEIRMTSFRKTALVGGILYVLTFLGSIPAAFLVVPVGR